MTRVSKKNSHGYRGVIIFLNRRCPVNCVSCNAGVQEINRKELTPGWLSAFFSRLRDVNHPGYIIWTGGEPFLSFEALEQGIALVSGESSPSYHSEILTSGAWFRENELSIDGSGKEGYLERLVKSGDFSLRISLDAEHQETVPVSRIIGLIEHAESLGIEINFTLRDIPGTDPALSPPASLETIEKQLPGFVKRNKNRSRWLHHIPHMPAAVGSCNRKEHKKEANTGKNVGKKGKYKGRCKLGFEDLVIGEDGLVYPCCGLFGVKEHQRLAVGNPLTESWETLHARRFERKEFRALKEKGPYEMLRQKGVEPDWWEECDLESPCQLCGVLFER